MVKVNLYTSSGVTKGSFELPADYSEKPNLNLLAQAYHIYQDRQHAGLARVKTRGEVAISTRKIYRQKGTGGARHGAKSAPIFVGGGVAHGPHGVKRQLTLPAKMKTKAFAMAISVKQKEGKLVAVDGLAQIKKTKDANTLITKIKHDLNLSENTKTVICLAESNRKVNLFFRNLTNATVLYFKAINAYDVLKSNLILFDKEAFIENRSVVGVVKVSKVVNKVKVSQTDATKAKPATPVKSGKKNTKSVVKVKKTIKKKAKK